MDNKQKQANKNTEKTKLVLEIYEMLMKTKKLRL